MTKLIELPEHVRAAIKSGPIPQVREWRDLDTAELTRGEKVCRFIETACIVPEGTLVGQNVTLDIFQEAFILAVYDNPNTTKVAVLSIGRKNAKTALIAFLLLAHIVGPEAVTNSRYNSGAMSRQQASEVFNYASKSARLSPLLSNLVHSVPSTKTITGLPMGTEYRALSSDASTNIGGSPLVAILDETGQVKGPQSDFIDAITTAQGAHDDALLFYISTQAATDADYLSILIDDAIINQPKDTVCHVYTSKKDCDVMDEKEWYKSNPALGKFRSYNDMVAQAQKAARTPSFRNTFRNLILNQRVARFATFIDPEEWKTCDAERVPLNECVKITAGLDLSSKNDLSALVLVGECESGNKHVYCMYWTPRQGLEDREDTDKAPYSLWEEQGFLNVIDGAVIDYEHIIEDAEAWFKDMGIKPDVVAFDRWRIDQFKKELERNGAEWPLSEFGQGFKDMAPALDALEDSVLSKTLAHGSNPVLNMCAVNSVSVKDAADNRKLEKRKASGRIDGMVALAMALGVLDDTEGRGPTEDELDDYYDNIGVI